MSSRFWERISREGWQRSKPWQLAKMGRKWDYIEWNGLYRMEGKKRMTRFWNDMETKKWNTSVLVFDPIQVFLPARQDCYQSYKHWAFPPVLRRPHCHRWVVRCHWTHLYKRPAVHLPNSWQNLDWVCDMFSHRSHCNIGRAPMDRLPECACKWQSSPDGWYGTLGVHRWYQRPFLQRRKQKRCWQCSQSC